MKKIRYIVVIFAGMFLLSSCEEVIEIDLNSSSPVIVAEANIYEGEYCDVKLSYTSDYFQVESSEKIEDAVVVLSDDMGNEETLVHQGEGYYVGSLIAGTAGRTYRLSMTIEDKEYSASSSMLTKPVIAYAEAVESIFNHPRMSLDSMMYNVNVAIADHPSEVNYYRLIYRNGSEEYSSSYLVLSDEYATNGNLTYPGMMYFYNIGDTVGLEAHSIDEDAYRFYNELNDVSGAGFAMSGTPYTPGSNFGSDVLGYFMAVSVSDTTFTVN